MIKEAHAIIKAFRWYRESPNRQYSGAETKKYDEAAELLTDREGFARFLVEKIKLSDGIRILEIASGTGLISQALREQENIVFSDYHSGPMGLLRKRVGGSASIAQANFLNLPFQDQTMDAIICVGGYRYVPQDKKEEFWQEMERVLQPRGKLYIAQFYPRLFPLRGSDISANGISSFGKNRTWEYPTKLEFNPGSLRGGRYLLYEFVLNKLPIGDHKTIYETAHA